MRKRPIPFEGKINIVKGDTVMVLAGKDRGKTGKVLRVFPDRGSVVVEGLNIAIKHQKGTPTAANPNPQGGKVEVPVPFNVGKVALVNADGEPTRVRIETGADGKRVRVAVKGGKPIADPSKG